MGKHCNRTVHVTAFISAVLAILASVAFFVLRDIRKDILFDIADLTEVTLEWQTAPYSSFSIVEQEQFCPLTHPSLVIYDQWPGLEIECFCQPDADYDSVLGSACDGDRSESTKCDNREALPAMYLPVLNGYKVCGERGAQPFKSAQRPIDVGEGVLGCPEETVPCDATVFESAVTKEEVLADPEHPANFVLCVADEKECPITHIEIQYLEEQNFLAVGTHKKAVNLPLLKMLLSHQQPCLKTGYYPLGKESFFADEIRKNTAPCPASEYFDAIEDPRFQLIDGGYILSQELFEQQNGLEDIWVDRYAQSEADKSLIRQERKDGSLFAFKRPTIGYSMACELDSGKLGRQEVFDQILSHRFKSQEPDIGKEVESNILIVIILATLILILQLFLTCVAGWKRGADEDDTFCDLYNEYRKTHAVITLTLTVILCLFAPVISTFVLGMIDAMDDNDFAENTLPQLEGCIDDYNIKEVIAESPTKTFDQVILLLIQIGLLGLFTFFQLLNLFSILLRRCVENREALEEFNMQMSHIKSRNNEDFDVVSDITDESGRREINTGDSSRFEQANRAGRRRSPSKRVF